MSNAIYENIVRMIPSNMGPRLKEIFAEHIGPEKSISKDELITAVFGCTLPKAYDTCERQIRDVMADLVTDETFDIVSTGDGYYQSTEGKHLIANIRELDSRIEKLEDRRDALYRILATKYKMVIPGREPQESVLPAKTMQKLKSKKRKPLTVAMQGRFF